MTFLFPGLLWCPPQDCYGVSLRNSSLVFLHESTTLTLHPTTTQTGVLVYKSSGCKGMSIPHVNLLWPFDAVWHQQYCSTLIHRHQLIVFYFRVSELSHHLFSNGLSSTQCKAITWTNANLLSYWTLMNILQWKFNQNTIMFIQDNVFENVI